MTEITNSEVVDFSSEEPLSLEEISSLNNRLIEDVAAGRINVKDAQEKQSFLLREATGFHHLVEGLRNKRWFNQRLEQEIGRSQREQSALSIITLDLDGFKDVNDQAGHLAGDNTLQEVGKILRQMAKRGVDVVAGMGGDEFAYILPSTNSIHSLVIAIKTLQAIPKISPINPRTGTILPVTASIGVTEFDFKNPETAGSFLERADQAQNTAKNGGKNSICLSIINDPTFSLDKLRTTLQQDVRITSSDKKQTIDDIINHTILVRK